MLRSSGPSSVIAMSASRGDHGGDLSTGGQLQRRSVLGLLGVGALSLPLCSMAEEKPTEGGKGDAPMKPEGGGDSTASSGGGALPECDTPKPKPGKPEVCEVDY